MAKGVKGFQKGNKIGGRFGAEHDATKGGRKLKIYNVIKELGYGADDIRAAFGEITFYNDKELKALAEDKEAPAISRILAKNMLNAIKTGNYKDIRDIAEQLIGRAKETKEINGNLLGANVTIQSQGEDPEVL